MSAEPELSVVLPAYREEANLRVLLPGLNRVLRERGETFEVLVVDRPEPSDRTGEVCERNGARRLPSSGGASYGCAVRTGLANSRGRCVLLMDADGSHAPEFIPTLLAERGRADVVVASRYVGGGGSENGFAARAMSVALNIAYARILGLRCKDVSNSFRLYRGDQVRGLRLNCEDFDIVEEILFRLSRARPGLRIVEVPFTFKKRMFGGTKRDFPRFVLGYIRTILRLRFFP